MKIRYIKYWAFAAVLGMGTVIMPGFINLWVLGIPFIFEQF